VLKGAGRDKTVIRALPELEVNDTLPDYLFDDPLDPNLPPWPFLVQFIGGEARVRDFTIEIPTPEPGQRPTRGWLGGFIFELDGALLFTGVDPVNFDVDRIRVVAGSDPASFFNTTLLNGAFFQGRLFNPADPGGYPVHPVTGRYSLSDSDFEGMLSGSPVAETLEAKVTIKNNRYRSGLAMHVQDASRSRLWILKNRWETEFVGLQVLLNVDGEPSERNSIFALGNRGSTVSPFEDFGMGVFFADPWDVDREPGGTALTLVHNHFSVNTVNGPALSGIDVVGAGRLIAWRNAVRGEVSLAAITVDSTSRCKIISNSLGAKSGPDVALGPATSECLAVVGRHDVVLDQGTNNRIIRR
jgi:hypothetical protein